MEDIQALTDEELKSYIEIINSEIKRRSEVRTSTDSLQKISADFISQIKKHAVLTGNDENSIIQKYLPESFLTWVALGGVSATTGNLQWRQPDSYENSYNRGDAVVYNGITYVSTVNGNIGSPLGYPQGWQKK